MRAFDFKNGDFVSTRSGTFSKISGIAKVARDIDKLLATDSEFAGSSTGYYRYNPNYGTRLNNKAIFNGLSRVDTVAKVNEVVKEALEYFVALQKNQSNLPIDETVNYFDYYSAFDLKNKTIVRTKIQIYMANGSTLNKSYFQEIA